MVRDLIEGGIDEAGELDLHHRPEALRREADGKPGDAGLGEWRVEDALGTEGLEQAIGGAEHAAVGADILAQHQHARLLRHGARQRQIDRLDEVDLRHRPAYPVTL